MAELEPLPADAMAALQHVAERSKRTVVRLPIDFIRASEYGVKPPLARLAKLGESRLRLYLTLKMIAAKAPHEMRALPPRQVATMLNFNDPTGSGIRVAQEALTALVKAKFVTRVSRPGMLADLTINTPGAPRRREDEKRWTNLPIELWTNGWIITLSGRALTAYIAVREVTGGRETTGTWIDGEKRSLYGLGDEIWRLGCKELEQFGIITTEIKPKPDAWRQIRRRKLYYLASGRIMALPGDRSTPASLAGP